MTANEIEAAESYFGTLYSAPVVRGTQAPKAPYGAEFVWSPPRETAGRRKQDGSVAAAPALPKKNGHIRILGKCLRLRAVLVRRTAN